jgi:CheY-like chemotaxis protein
LKQKLNCVLLIDDDEPTNFLTKMVLEEAGCTEHIHIEESGQAALDFLSRSGIKKEDEETSSCPDLIFVDINMPAMNGWEFMEHYSSLEKHKKGKIVMVMLTTSLNPDDRQKAEHIKDISGFETKPLNPEKLNQILQKYFPERVEGE